MKLSIIICVYNTSPEYLEECLESIVSSTAKDLHGGYEICLVDDGSTVDYTALLKKYSVKYKKTDNRGIFSARKTGAEMADGEYSIYCDSDDTVSFNYYLPMVEAAQKRCADIVINDWAYRNPRSRNYCKNDDTIRNDIEVSGDEVLLEFFKNEGRQHSYYVLWNKLYKTTLLKKAFNELADADFPLHISYSEDAAINFFIWRSAKKVINVHTGFYFYRIHDAQTVAIASPEKLLTQINAMAVCLEIMRNNTSHHPKHDQICHHIDEWSALMSRSHYTIARSQGYTELYPIIKEKYGVEKLSVCTSKDGSTYAKKISLGANFAEVDSLLLSIWNLSEEKTVSCKGNNKYITASLDFLEKRKPITRVKGNADITVPPLKTPLKEKFIYNPLIYKIGLILFKKGSKLRNFLKKFI